MLLHRRHILMVAALILRIGGAEAEEMTASHDAAPRLLVLTSGQVITGSLKARQDGYDVVRPDGGRIFLASPQIRFEANDLPEAYQKMRRSLPELTPARHVELARWCLANQLNEQAKRELLDALHLDPNREEAKQILQMIVRRQQAGRLPDGDDSGAAVLPDNDQLRSGGPGYSVPGISVPGSASLPMADARSLGGLSRPVAQAFVRRIQPLLNSRCISCHASGQNDFTLISTRGGSTPLIAERNLTAVLQQLDLTDPESSPLLRAATEPHGGSRVAVLHGRVGRTQADLVRSWIQSVASHQGISGTRIVSQPEAASATGSVVAALAGHEKADRGAAEPRAENSHRTAPESLDTGAGRTLSTAETDARVMGEIRFRNRRDAFDPEVFNRKFHFATVPTATTAPENPASARVGP